MGKSELLGKSYSGYHNTASDVHYYPKVKYVKARVSKIINGIDGTPSGIELKYCEYDEAMNRRIEPLSSTIAQWRTSYMFSHYCGVVPLKYPVKYIVKEYPDFVAKVESFDSHIYIVLRGAPGGWFGNLVLSNSFGEVTILLDAMEPSS